MEETLAWTLFYLQFCFKLFNLPLSCEICPNNMITTNLFSFKEEK